MYRDANSLPNGGVLSGFDVCIVGAGAAGIAMARQLAGSNVSVLMLCNGSPTDAGTPGTTEESLYAGTIGPFLTNVDRIFLQRSRLNMYGGTTNHFWFYAHPMEATDLEPRPGYREAHWPISIGELGRYYPLANTYGNYGPFSYDFLPFWEKKLHGVPFAPEPGDAIRNVIWHAQEHQKLYEFQTRFGPELEAAANITVLFHAQALTVNAPADGGSVTSISCAAIDGTSPGVSFQVIAGRYVLAVGGIESVRLLKNSHNLGDNAKGHLGRGFMLHPLIWEAALVTMPEPVSPTISNFYTPREVYIATKPDGSLDEERPVIRPSHPGEAREFLKFWAWGLLAPTPGALALEQMGNFHSNLFINGDQITVSMNWESVPNEASTITLDSVIVDPLFGQPAVHVDWNLLESEKQTIIKGLDLLKSYFMARGAVDFEIKTDLSGGPEHWTFIYPLGQNAGLQAGDHHMGALRMSASPEDGIVDVNCRVHTVDNLYVAGSAVYPTSGHANPTLTIVALALRLADHLKAISRTGA